MAINYCEYDKYVFRISRSYIYIYTCVHAFVTDRDNSRGDENYFAKVHGRRSVIVSVKLARNFTR